MKIAVHDPLKTFPAFLPHVGKNHDVLWIDTPVTADELRWQHIRCDLVWYEFCDEVFYQMMRGPKECKIVNRLHSYELFTDVPGRVNWYNCDLLLASSDHVKSVLEAKNDVIDFPVIDVLSNGPDLDKIKMPERHFRGKRIALVSRINYKKNVPLAVYCLDALPDKEYELHIFGGSQDLRFDMYLRHLVKSLHLEDRVFFHGEHPHDDVVDALGYMDFIISTSLYESFGQGIMEGIARGCLPIIHDFPGARERFSGMGDIFFSTPRQFVDVIARFTLGDVETLNRTSERNLDAIRKYDLSQQIITLDKVLARIEDGLDDYKN